MADGGAPRPTTRRLQRMVRAYREAGALMAAVELGLFTHIAEGHDDEASLTQAMGLQPLHGERIIVAALGLGLIERSGDRLVLTPDVERFLVKGKPTYAGEWMLFTKPDWNHWGRLAEVLAEQAPPVLENKTVDGITIEEARRYHRGTYSIGRGAGRLFLNHVDLSGKQLMIDIGGGSGAYCIEACKRYPDLKAVVLELPAVVPVTQEFIDENGLGDRIEARVCDFNKDPFPDGADVAVMASNLPMYGREAIAAVVKKAYGAMAPGGDFHLIGEALDADRSGPADPALWGLAQAINNTTGIAHSVGEVEGYFRDAGFKDVQTNEFVEGILQRTSGRR
jgi:hypothetical protein